MEIESRHQCFIYDGPPSHQLSVLAAAIEQKLEEGHRCLYMSNPAMVAGLRSYLSSLGVNVLDEIANSRLILSSDSACTEDGRFDPEFMLNLLEATLDKALSDGFKGLFATGDMTWEFGAEKNFEKLLDYEQRLEQLFHKRPELHGICQYHRDTLPAEAPRKALLTHQTIFINQTLARFNPIYVAPGLATEQMAMNPALDEKIAELCK